MLPMLAIVDVRSRSEGERPFRIHLWLPLFLVWLLLLPFALLLSPFLLLAVLLLGRNPITVLAALVGLLNGFSGILVEVSSPDAFVFIRVL
jgi:hypothetical protein